MPRGGLDMFIAKVLLANKLEKIIGKEKKAHLIILTGESRH